MINHPFLPVYDKDSEILILGSFPSVISRKENFYYANKQNRFWKVLAAVLEKDVPATVEDKKRLLSENKIALWDVIESCEIIQSYDSSIRNVKVNDLSLIVNNGNIRKIGCNGDKAYQLYKKYVFPTVKIEAVRLPSTSSANAGCKLDNLTQIYREFIKH
ncbi:MAG: DNA-deoxyinosine glycosylase [Erysipelotrichia bacterium]|nr:DNA-deoxyinosine glycosylase [Erysipelotrichia bacterium]